VARQRDVVEADDGNVVGHPATGLAKRPQGAEGDDVAGDEDRRQVGRPGQQLGHRDVAARRIERSLGDETRIERQPGGAERVPIAGEAIGGCGVREWRVGDAADAAVAELDEMLDGGARTRRLSTSTLGAATDGREPCRMIGNPSCRSETSSSSSTAGRRR